MRRAAPGNGSPALANPGHAVGTGAGLEAPGGGLRFQIDDGDVVLAVDGDVGARAGRLDEDAFDALPEREMFRRRPRRDVDEEQLARVEVRDQDRLAVRRELQPVRALRLDVKRLDDLLLLDV